GGRLSIIDLAGGKQPMYNEDGSVVVTFNGEIYNYQMLRDELIDTGHSFQTQSDTEVLVHGWEEWQQDSVTRLNGMFAYALWDDEKQHLFLARDRLGIKPLYYARLPSGFLIFASELKALLVHPELNRELDPCAIEEYMALGYVPEPRTILNSVTKLEPGHTLLLPRGNCERAQPRQYWDIPCMANEQASEDELVAKLLSHLSDSVQRRMIADVPLGAFLSGGVDSSAVVSAMAGLSSGPVLTCSMSFAEDSHDESQYAARVARQYCTDHSSQEVASADFDLIDTLATVYDEPFADSSAIPTYRVCEIARRRVKVALSGDGADESFGGYRRYRLHCNEERARAMLPLGVRRSVFGPMGRLYPKLDWGPRFLRAKTTLSALAMDPVEAYLDSVSRCSTIMRNSLYTKEFKTGLQGHAALDYFRRHAKNSPVADGLALIQYLDFKTWLPGDILTKVDRASMAHGLEVRVPFLDHEYVEWACGLGDRYKIRNGTGKYLLKRALESRLDKDILYRQKMGFSVPLADWLRGPARGKMRERLGQERLGRLGVFDMTRVGKLRAQHERGESDHATTLWSLLMFETTVSRILDMA
ncbi:MAG: amidotransferase 1, exosortase A system-associated, partial [Gammaproteobacteria bacterium]|nr:amidotransferase 1, exosortase A system-associated [Gammaproteobacteria bacterium]